jgi:fructose-1,6-bisphosphatase
MKCRKKNEMKKLNARCIGAMIAVVHRRLRAFTGLAKLGGR